MQVHAEIAQQYDDFAAYAEVDSPCFADWARRVVDDHPVLDWLETLPVPKRQPNLVFAAARWHGVGAPAPYEVLREALLGDPADGGTIAATVRRRTTQTNEAGRLATLLPALALAAGNSPEPLALVEVGASAGLCLYPDAYAYRWVGPTGDVALPGPSAGSHELRCDVTGDAPLPGHLPRVTWRGGIDLNPLDVTDDDATDWLRTLVWPEAEDRRERLAAAVEVARADPPTLVRGDLLEDLPAVLDLASAHGPVVVFHSAVAAYLDPAERDRFVAMMTDLVTTGACRWISNEGAGVLLSVDATAPASPPAGRFVLGLDGQALAWTHGHGHTLDWL